MPTFAETQKQYSEKLSRMSVRSPKWQNAIDRAAKYIVANRARYEQVGQVLGVPWYWIGAAHWREATGSFRGVLHNGEKIIGTGKKTRLVPSNRGPFKTWEEAAVDALKLKELDKVEEWTPERECYEAERFNGWGYRNKGIPSAYLWSGTNNYTSGKYVRDRVFSPTAVDQQVGVVPVMHRVKSLVADQEARQFVTEHSQKAAVLSRVKTAAKVAGGTAGSIFTLDNLGVFQGWMGLFAGLGTIALVAGIVVLGYWFLSEWLLKMMAEDAKKGRYVPSGAEGKAEAPIEEAPNVAISN